MSAPDRRMLDRFIRLCEISSPTGQERAVADDVLRELRELGVQVGEDDKAGEARAGAGNLIARIPGDRAGWLSFFAHLDTVPPEGALEPVVALEQIVVAGHHEHRAIQAGLQPCEGGLRRLRVARVGHVPDDDRRVHTGPPEHLADRVDPAGQPGEVVGVVPGRPGRRVHRHVDVADEPEPHSVRTSP